MVIIVLHSLRTPSTEILRELTDSRYTVFDVLPAFFANDDPWVTLGRPFPFYGWALTPDIFQSGL